ncbi:chorismate synthase [Marinitoga hydrogenitolerans DSM 16785]|uniref:Chorismate synthase n=1 Tax=Marinitoga hydrogenitolerans (strain DSM 16785 / JCM 12826 / AT1271) TaxID=1122195 RepID=A0A1M4ZTB2_MARH1|nr:chorismate synthase [Marinitoga hydrogenitolerans]SHF21320.1 chorismate synthase [Marinitoga hydrogenitolerans DSM 16785]
MNYFISGDSHGSAMIGVLTGIPAGMKLNIEKINKDLLKRQSGYGRGKRMKIENDKVKIISGLWKGYTTGAPITILIENKGKNTEKDIRSIPRPGHGDYSAYMKYKLPDLNIYTERNSARWTVVLTALGAIAKQFIEKFGIEIYGYVKSIGEVLYNENNFDIKKIEESIVKCPDEKTTKLMTKEIDLAKKEGITLGGSVKIIAQNIKPGLGGYSDIFEKIDSKIGKLFMSIPSVKGLIIGNEDFTLSGRDYHDEFILDGDKNIRRKTNNAGGIEAGITNGENIEITVFLKPIPTLATPLNSVDLKIREETKAPYIRSDVTIIPSSVIILENALSLVLAESIIERFGNDNMTELIRRYNSANIFNWDDGFWENNNR